MFSTDNDDDELTALRHDAWPLGLDVGRHRVERDYYASYLHGGGIIRHATADQVRALMFEHAKPHAPSAPRDDSEDEIWTLRNAARPLGLWVGIHRHYDPTRGGKFFIIPRKTHPDERTDTLAKYLTAAAVEDFLQRHAEQ